MSYLQSFSISSLAASRPSIESVLIVGVAFMVALGLTASTLTDWISSGATELTVAQRDQITQAWRAADTQPATSRRIAAELTQTHPEVSRAIRMKCFAESRMTEDATAHAAANFADGQTQYMGYRVGLAAVTPGVADTATVPGEPIRVMAAFGAEHGPWSAQLRQELTVYCRDYNATMQAMRQAPKLN